MHEKEVPTVSQSSKRLDYSSLLALKVRDYAVWYINKRYLQFFSNAASSRYKVQFRKTTWYEYTGFVVFGDNNVI